MRAERPRFWRFLSFSQSSRKPIAPKTRAKRKTNRCTNFPRIMLGKPIVSSESSVPRINMTPPMMGVPLFDLCHSTSLLIFCPAFCLRSQGI